MKHTEIDFFADTTLIDFNINGVLTHVRYRYDLSHPEIRSIQQAAMDVPFKGDAKKWVEAVMTKAHEDDAWRYEVKPDAWKIWKPNACTTIEVD